MNQGAGGNLGPFHARLTDWQGIAALLRLIGGGMNIYHCMIELKDGARALAFAAAVEAWMSYLKSQRLILDWRLMRRKFRLASGAHTDFLLEIDVGGLADLDLAFAALSSPDEAAERRYDQMHQMIGQIEVGLYRPFPDATQRERIALI